jgi:hypothetical protein
MKSSIIKSAENEIANIYLTVLFILPPRYASMPPMKGVRKIVMREMFMGRPRAKMVYRDI